jgi:hypothetical protein
MVKRRLQIALLLAVVVASFSYVIVTIVKPKTHPHLNVLVVSFCSFRMQLLSHYGGNSPQLLPAMEEFMKNASFVFDNVYNGMPWLAVSTFNHQRIPSQTFTDLGYHFLGHAEKGHLERIPMRRTRLDRKNASEINDNDFEKQIAGITEYLGSVAASPSMQPFFGTIHYKYLHYPLIDRFNADSNWDMFLNSKDRQKIAEYLAHPENYSEKLPFLMLLADDPRIAINHPEVQRLHWKKDQASLIQLTGLLTNPRFIKAWKESAGYKDDMRLLEAVYNANAKYLDKVLAPALNLWGNKELQDNTVVVMIGDHGEMHMERDQLTHGNSLYDESLHVPMALRFPLHWGGAKIVAAQMHFATVAKLLGGIVSGEISEDNLPSAVAKLDGDTVLLRDCLNTLRGLRLKNKYKYFVKIASGERFLYDLEKDPQELDNIALRQNDLTDSLEALYWEKYPEFSDISPYQCAPWPGAA